MFTPTGRIVAIAATTSGGLINLNDATGAVAVAGKANDGPGGVVSATRRARRSCGRSREGGEGILEVYNESTPGESWHHESETRISPPSPTDSWASSPS